MRIIRVPPGIGDNIWILQKLINTGEQFIFHIPATNPLRGKQIFDLLPQVSAQCEYNPLVSFKQIKRETKNLTWREIRKMPSPLSLQANSHLEAGNRIEHFIRDLPVSYKLDYITSDQQQVKARKLIPAGKRYIGIYGSCYSVSRAWNFWNELQWYELIYMLRSITGAHFIIFGAEWDTDLGTKLVMKLRSKNIPHTNTIGHDLGTVVEMMKRLDYFFGFPSGLSILNETLGKDGFMFYPPHLRKLIGTWADPSRIGTRFKEAEFCSPAVAFDWFKKNYSFPQKPVAAI